MTETAIARPKTIYIAGLGLIGASLALGIKRDHPEYRVLGYNRSEESRQIARRMGCVDEVTDEFAHFAPLADVIILSVPIQQTIDFIKQLADLPLKETVIITDTGSTKAAIMAAAQTYLADKPVQFVGGHPMAGSHKTGAISADVNLFENAYYIFTPSNLSSPAAISELKTVLSGLHARYVEVDATEHDLVTGQISHFPHILASSLMEQAGDFVASHPLTQNFAAGGFRDMTRIAASEPGMWTSIVLTNPEAVTERLLDFKNRLNRVIGLIEQRDEQGIWAFFEHGRALRQQMEIHKRGGVDSSYDLFIDIPDQADVILQILELLRGTSLVNIRVHENNREDIHGVLQLSFRQQSDRERSASIIKEKTSYRVYLA